MSLQPGTFCTCVHELLERVVKLRKNEFVIDPEDFAVLNPDDKHAYARLFAQYFVCGFCQSPTCSTRSDDMLWYVRMPSNPFYGTMLSSASTSSVEVYRRQSKKMPCPGDNSVDWQETVMLNVILQQIEYFLTCAVCMKTTPQNLQILRKNTQPVFPSPSRRRMDSKGEAEELTYPNIFFTVDCFEEIFSDIVVREGECVCVELVARDRSRVHTSALFLGSIRYEVLKHVYDGKQSSTLSWTQKLMSSLIDSSRRFEFVRMRGPHGKGHAEMAVSRVEIPGYATPTVEGAFDEFRVDPSEAFRHRRVSESNMKPWQYLSNAPGRYRVAPPEQPPPLPLATSGLPPKRSASEVDVSQNEPVVDANEESVLSRLWGSSWGRRTSSTSGAASARSPGQIPSSGSMATSWGSWMRSGTTSGTSTPRRVRGPPPALPLNAYLTYVTLPWSTIIEDLLENRKRPILTLNGSGTDCEGSPACALNNGNGATTAAKSNGAAVEATS